MGGEDTEPQDSGETQSVHLGGTGNKLWKGSWPGGMREKLLRVANIWLQNSGTQFPELIRDSPEQF